MRYFQSFKIQFLHKFVKNLKFIDQLIRFNLIFIFFKNKDKDKNT
jgi:hypothetical protein